jgi:signal peptidase I
MSGRRGLTARIGLALLNLLFPGSGMVRAGRVRAGLGLAATSFALLVAIDLIGRFMRIGLPQFMAIAVIYVLALALLLIGAVWTFLSSRERKERSWASSWGVVAGLAAVSIAVSWVLGDIRSLRSYRTVSDSMAPLLLRGDRLIAGTRLGPLARGPVVVVRHGGKAWISRIVGLPGDIVQVDGGLVSIDGRRVAQHAIKQTKLGTMLWEQLPGEVNSHVVIDMGVTPGDDFGPVKVPVGQYFMMGDNRDNALDSRFSADAFGGLGMIAVKDIMQRVDFLYWSNSPKRRFQSIETLQAHAAERGEIPCEPFLSHSRC